MTKQPEALRIADVLIGSPQCTGTPIWEAADILRRQHALIENLQKALREVPSTQLHYADHIRRQHEAIKVLREALENYIESDQTACDYGVGVGGDAMFDAEQALKETEGL